MITEKKLTQLTYPNTAFSTAAFTPRDYEQTKYIHRDTRLTYPNTAFSTAAYIPRYYEQTKYIHGDTQLTTRTLPLAQQPTLPQTTSRLDTFTGTPS